MRRVVERGIPAYRRSGLFPQVPAWALYLVYAGLTVRLGQILPHLACDATEYAATPSRQHWMSIPASGAADTRHRRPPSIA